ncbi:FMN-linked oxidoreductase [Xylariaceae sp. FL0016]|nr:FMN-linked oxidoreductase [Xylariaceae sp. FL0016]
MASTTPKPKLHGRAFYESIGSPQFIVAPMVDQSEFAWRMLTRSFLTPAENAKTLAYTPMFHARLFEEAPKYRESHFQPTKEGWVPAATNATDSSLLPAPEEPSRTTPFLDGNPKFDRPLFVQFCANDPQILLGAAKKAAPYCDAVDLNLGCPQGIARKGHYGAFLQEDQQLVYNLINTLHKELPIPVTAKIRILDTKENTLKYAQNVLAAGASIITVHGRRREQKGHLTGVADWEYLRYLRGNLPPETVIFANGNILQHGDIERCLEATGADAVMSAEGNLSDPAVFATPPPPGQEGREYWRGRDGKGGWRVDAVFRRYMDIIYKHVLQQEPPTRRPLFVVGDDEAWLHEVETKDGEEDGGPARKKRKTDGSGGKKREDSPNLVAMRPHLFHLLRHFISRHTDIRDMLAKTHAVVGVEKVLEMVEQRIAAGMIEYEKTDGLSIKNEPEIKPNKQQAPASKSKERKEEIGEAGGKAIENDPESSVATVNACKRPWWVAQPIIRPLPKEALANGAISISKKQQKKEAAASEANTAKADARVAGQSTAVEKELPSLNAEVGAKEPQIDPKDPGKTTDALLSG